MKKIISTLLAAATLLALVIPMTSCSETARLSRMEEAERAVAFFALVEEKTDGATSVSMEQKMSFKLDIGDVAYEQVNEGTITYIEEGEKLTYLEQSTTTVWAGGEKTVTYLDEGFMDGMMFTSYKEGKVENKLKSPITREEYEAFQKNKTADVPDMGVGEGYCTVMTCKQAEDGTWTATYEGFTEEGMKTFTHLLKGVETAINAEHTLRDVRLTATADADLNPLSQTIEFLFEEKEGAETRVPAIKVENRYKGLNNTVLAEPYDLSDFTETEDIRIIENFTNAMSDRESAESGAFHVITKAEASYMGQSNKTKTEQDVTYKNLNGYAFTLDYTQEGYAVTISYKNGSMTTVVREEKTGTKVDSSTEKITDFEAQITVRQLMNSESVSAMDIIGAEVKNEEKGLYRLTLGDAVKNELEEQYEEAYGSGIRSFIGYIDATVVEGELISYTYHVDTKLDLEGETMTITVDYTVTFSELVENGESV